MNLTGGAHNIHCSVRPTQGLSWGTIPVGTRSAVSVIIAINRRPVSAAMVVCVRVLFLLARMIISSLVYAERDRRETVRAVCAGLCVILSSRSYDFFSIRGAPSALAPSDGPRTPIVCAATLAYTV